MKHAVIDVQRLTPEGDGIGRIPSGSGSSDKVAFVPYSLPAESIRCQCEFEKTHYSRWIPADVLSASPDRCLPRCPLHFTPGRNFAWCGGCNWQHMASATQRKYKRELLAETLTRIGGFAGLSIGETLASPDDWRYRNKVQIPFGNKGNRPVAGFYAPGSHEIVEFDDCPIQPEVSLQILRSVKRLAAQFHWEIYDEDRHLGWLRHLLVRTNRANEALVALVTATPAFPAQNDVVKALRSDCPSMIGFHQNIQPARSHVILGREWISLWGADEIVEPVLGLKMGYAPGAFFQVNTGAAERLYEKVLSEADLQPGHGVVDFYCGVGAMALLAARKVDYVIGIDEVPSAIQGAEMNARRNGIKNVRFETLKVESAFLPAHRSLFERFDSNNLVVILDPPRSGCDPLVIQGLLALKPSRIIYVSCHPATLARDLKMLSSSYQIKSVTPVDLFPQTSHIETVVRLDIHAL